MYRYILALGMAFGMAVSCPTAAWAQINGNIGLTINGQEQDGLMNVIYVNASQCEQDVPFKFALKRMGADGTSDLRDTILQVWTDPSTMSCSASTRRTAQNESECDTAPCTFVDQQTITNTEQDLTIELSAKELFGDDSGQCRTGGKVTVTFVAVSGDTCNPAPDNLLGTFDVTFTLRTGGAATPSNVKATDGDSDIRVSWDRNGGSQNDTYTVYVDTAPGTNCSEGMLGGELEAAAADDLDLERIRDISGTSTSINPEKYGIEYDDYVQVAVSTEDQAENRSKLSKPVCAQRVETVGPVEYINSKRGEGNEVCSSVGAPLSRSSWMVALSLGVLGLLVWRRARSRT